MDVRFQHRQRDAHVRGMHRDAGIAGAEDRVHAVEPADRRAAGARLALVARRRDVVEIGAARALKRDCRPSSPCCAAAAMRRRAARSTASDSGARPPGDRPGRNCAPARRCASRRRRSPRPCRVAAWSRRSASPAVSTSIFIRSTRLVPPATNLAPGVAAICATASATSVGARIFEADHDCPIACWIAATMLG